MNIVLWILQGVLSVLCIAGGAYKLLAFDELAKMPATAELSRFAWTAFGAVEIVCGILLIVPAALKRWPILTPVAAALLVVESLILAMLYGRHSSELTAANPLVWVLAMALMAAVVAYGRYPTRCGLHAQHALTLEKSMNHRKQYSPGPANVARVEKDGEHWALVLVKELRHSPEKVWQALTDPQHLREWAPFDADRNLGAAGSTVKLTTVGTPHVTETKITRADPPHVLIYKWGDFDVRWELDDYGGGTRLTLWANIDRRYISMGAAGWHICLDVLEHYLDGTPLGRIVGPETMKFEGWQRLNREYAKQFGVDSPA